MTVEIAGRTIGGMVSSRPALIIAARGSKLQGCREALDELAREVARSHGVGDAFSIVQAAHLSGPPTVPSAAQVALSAGCAEVVVVPLLLAASSLAGEELSALLGRPASAPTRARLMARPQRALAAGLPVRLVELDRAEVEGQLFRSALRRSSLTARPRATDAVVLCVEGDAVVDERSLRSLRLRLMEAGFGYAAHALVGAAVGHSPAPTARAVVAASRMAGIRRVHIIPLMVSLSRLHRQAIEAAAVDAGRRLGGVTLRYQPHAILPDGDLASHIGLLGLRALGVFPALRGAEVDA